MSNTIMIDGREAVPLRLLPFASQWLTAHTVALALAHRAREVQGDPLELTGYHFADGQAVSTVPWQWDTLVDQQTALENTLRHGEEFEGAGEQEWLAKCHAMLPAGGFVWRDELALAYSAAFLDENHDEASYLRMRAGDETLDLECHLSPLNRHVVFEGFQSAPLGPDHGRKSKSADAKKKGVPRTTKPSDCRVFGSTPFPAQTQATALPAPDAAHYSEFLRVDERRRIRWALDDALKLAAGFIPVIDAAQDLNPQLRASNGQVEVNHKGLMGALLDTSFSFARPTIEEQDKILYVDACEFLEWLSQYLAHTQCGIPFPCVLLLAVTEAIANAPPAESMRERPYRSLATALDGWLGKKFGELPSEQQELVKEDWFLRHLWDAYSEEQRRQRIWEIDYRADPDTQDERDHFWQQFTDIKERKALIAQVESEPTHGFNEGEAKRARLLELWRGLAEMERKYAEAKELSDDEDSIAQAHGKPHYPAVWGSTIMTHFVVKVDVEENDSWWKERLGHAGDYSGLVDCRVGTAIRGRPSMWRADLIAAWLVQHRHMNESRARTALEKFHGYKDRAAELFPREG